MCEANAYMLQDDKENLILESVDLVKPHDDGGYLLVDIFGTQKIVQGRLKQMNLVDHRIIFEAS
jgi:predicted RNA-binding protein